MIRPAINSEQKTTFKSYRAIHARIDAMSAVGDALPSTLKETAGGGLAATPTGRKLQEMVFGKK